MLSRKSTIHAGSKTRKKVTILGFHSIDSNCQVKMTHPSWEQRLIYSTLSDERDHSYTDFGQFQQSATSSSNEECKVVKKSKEFRSWISPLRSTSSQQSNSSSTTPTTLPKSQGGNLVTTIVNSAKTIGNRACSFVLSTPDKTKRNDKNADEVTPVMLYADADVITTMKRVDHVDPFSFLEIKPVELFPSKDSTTTAPTTNTNASFSLLSLESIDQKDDELVVFNSTIFTTTTATDNNKNLERSRSFCQSPLPFHYNSNIEDATVEVKNSINSINHLEVHNAKEGSLLNAEESSSSSSSSDSGSSYYSFSDLSWDGFEPYHPPLPSTATMRRSKRDKNILPWKDEEFITFFKEG